MCVTCYNDWYSREPKHVAERLVRRKANYDKNTNVFRTKAREWRDANPGKWMLLSAKARAKQTGIAFAITVKDFTIPTHCPMLGILLVRAHGGSADNSPTLDRIDSTRGYVPGNVWVVSHRANRIKTDATLEELERLAVALRERIHGAPLNVSRAG